MTDSAETELLLAFQKGEVPAFEKIYKLYYKTLRIQAFLILNNEDDAEDQVQQLFLDIWNRQLYKNVHHSLKAYLFTAIRNRCYNCFTRTSYIDKAKNEYAQTLAVSEPVETNEQPGLVTGFQSALKKLPPQRYRAFYLIHVEDKKYIQAAHEMGISINSLKSHLKLAIKSLKSQLQH